MYDFEPRENPVHFETDGRNLRKEIALSLLEAWEQDDNDFVHPAARIHDTLAAFEAANALASRKNNTGLKVWNDRAPTTGSSHASHRGPNDPSPKPRVRRKRLGRFP